MMNFLFSLKNRYTSSNSATYKPQIKRSTLTLVLLVFVAIAAMQAVQLGDLLSEAKAVRNDVRSIKAEHQLLRAQYATYQNNLSYLFEE